MEWVAFIFGVLQVVLAWKNIRFNFIAGAISVTLYSYLFFEYKLYAESTLNIYYLIISVLGWISWARVSNPKISYTSFKEWVYTLVFFALAFTLLSWVLTRYTSSDVPYWDALVSSLAWAGSWLLIKRKVENWLVLNLSNMLAIPLLFIKNLELTALLTVIYIIVAIIGYLDWKKQAATN